MHLLGELHVLRQVFQGPQIEVPNPPTSGGQPRLGTLVAIVHISITYIDRVRLNHQTLKTL